MASHTRTEAAQLADQFEQLPAGVESIFGILLMLLLVLLITDIAGYTEIFPFVKKSEH